MQEGWSTRKITFLLYVIVLLFSFSFFFIHHSFESVKNSTEALRSVGQTGTEIQRYGVVFLTKHVADADTAAAVDEGLSAFRGWMQSASGDDEALEKSFSSVHMCWDDLKNAVRSGNDPDVIGNLSYECSVSQSTLSLIAGKVILMEKRKAENILYIESALMMILTLFVIYFVRVYIHLQEKKHSIYDIETKLFNKLYFDAELGKHCAQVQRSHDPLSILCVRVTNFGAIENTKKAHMLSTFGAVFNSIVRESDIAAYCKEGTFAMLLPQTEKAGADVLKSRLLKRLQEVGAVEELSFDTTVFECQDKECASCETMIKQYLHS